MSTSLQVRALHTADKSAGRPHSAVHRRPTTSRARLPQTLLGIFCAALALRLFHVATAYNIFIDEVLYSQVGHNLADGNGITLFGNPFNVHPPAPFGILAGAIHLFDLSNGTTDPDRLLLQLRPVIAVFGALTVVTVYLVARLCRMRRGVRIGVTALVMLDPFQISFDSRVMLEAIAQFFVISTVLGLLVLPPRGALTSRRPAVMTIGAGVAAGLVFSTKETFGLVTAAMLLVLLFVPHLVARRRSLSVLAIGASTYVLIVSTSWISAGFGPWWDSKTSGVQRLIGTKQTTGFNANVSNVTLTSRIFANVGEFGATYLILLAGGVATVVHLLRTRPWQGNAISAFERARTIVSIWNLCACGYLVYATLLGSIEEQMYYIPLVPCILSLGFAASSVRRVRLGRAILAVGLVTLIFQASVWTSVHRTNNNLYENFLAWQRTHVLPGAVIGVTDEPASFLVKNANIGAWPTLAQLRANNADYVLVDSTLVDQGYSKMSAATFDYLRAHARVAYRTSTSGDTLYFFDLRGVS